MLRGEATASLPSDAPDVVMMRSAAYGALTKLCGRAPTHVRTTDARLPAQLFSALESPPPLA